jgi:hypothetical protein
MATKKRIAAAAAADNGERRDLDTLKRRAEQAAAAVRAARIRGGLPREVVRTAERAAEVYERAWRKENPAERTGLERVSRPDRESSDTDRVDLSREAAGLPTVSTHAGPLVSAGATPVADTDDAAGSDGERMRRPPTLRSDIGDKLLVAIERHAPSLEGLLLPVDWRVPPNKLPADAAECRRALLDWLRYIAERAAPELGLQAPDDFESRMVAYIRDRARTSRNGRTEPTWIEGLEHVPATQRGERKSVRRWGMSTGHRWLMHRQELCEDVVREAFVVCGLRRAAQHALTTAARKRKHDESKRWPPELRAALAAIGRSLDGRRRPGRGAEGQRPEPRIANCAAKDSEGCGPCQAEHGHCDKAPDWQLVGK